MISIVKGPIPGSHYVGRPTPLGNPFPATDKSLAARNIACDRYHEWFYAKVKSGDEAVLNELRILYRKARDGDLMLRCYCAPLRCHSQTIKDFLDGYLNSIGD